MCYDTKSGIQLALKLRIQKPKMQNVIIPKAQALLARGVGAARVTGTCAGLYKPALPTAALLPRSCGSWIVLWGVLPAGLPRLEKGFLDCGVCCWQASACH